MGHSLFCIAKTTDLASGLIAQLNGPGIALRDMSVLMPDKSGTRDFAHEKGSKAPEGAVTGAGAGGLLGGTFGLLASIGAIAIPGVGAVLAAGPIPAALSGVAVGAAVGGIGGALIGHGIPECVAKRYEGKIASDNILISVLVRDSDREAATADVKARDRQATDVRTTGGLCELLVFRDSVVFLFHFAGTAPTTNATSQ